MASPFELASSASSSFAFFSGVAPSAGVSSGASPPPPADFLFMLQIFASGNNYTIVNTVECELMCMNAHAKSLFSTGINNY